MRLCGWWHTIESLHRDRLWAFEGMCNFPGCPLADRHSGPHLFDEEMAAAETELDAIRAAQDRWKDAEGADGDDSRPSSAISTVSTQLSFATELSDASVFDMGGTFDLGGFEVGGAAEGEARYDSRMDSSSCSSESQLSAAQL